MNESQAFLNPTATDGITYASVFAGNLSMLLSIIIGVVAMVLVLRAAKKLGGGLFGSVLNYIGSGMALIVLATISIIVGEPILGPWANITNVVCFVMGYVFIVLGANKLFKGIMST